MNRAAASLVLALALSLLAGGCARSLPPPVAEEMARTPRGMATIVFFTDFQCPHCRRMHALLRSILAERSRPVRIVLRHVPLPRHPDARAAARAAVCVEKLSPRTRDFADALFAADDLGDPSLEDLALARGVSLDAFVTCTADAGTDTRIDRDVASFDALGGDGVPLLFIGRRRLEGTQPRDVVEEAIDDAVADAK
jgi:protein-disulfide isomerase